jgi:hypothetical protein
MADEKEKLVIPFRELKIVTRFNFVLASTDI